MRNELNIVCSKCGQPIHSDCDLIERNETDYVCNHCENELFKIQH